MNRNHAFQVGYFSTHSLSRFFAVLFVFAWKVGLNLMHYYRGFEGGRIVTKLGISTHHQTTQQTGISRPVVCTTCFNLNGKMALGSHPGQLV